jgi:organic hydroperoxide reductase OsmC/OhrA
VATRSRTFEYAVTLAGGWEAASDRGGVVLPNDDENWTPEHLLLAALNRCALTSFRHHARRAGLEPSSSGRAHGVVAKRAEDGRFGFVEIEVDLDVRLEPEPERADVHALVAKAERDCFVGASLRIEPVYRWTVDGRRVE